MSEFGIAGIQMDVVAGHPERNLEQILGYAEQAAELGAQLVVFPECALTGYCFDSLEEAQQNALSMNSDCFRSLAEASEQLKVAICVGSLLREEVNGEIRVRNSVLTFHEGKCIDTYHKIHLPFLGVDRFVTPGETIHQPISIEGLKVGIHICYEGGFPEVARTLALDGADLVILPTNWPPGSSVSWQAIPMCRSLENRVFFMSVNRIGNERGTEFIGHSTICGVTGEWLATAEHDRTAMIFAQIDPEEARRKHLILEPGKYEVDRIGDRRPDLYHRLTQSDS